MSALDRFACWVSVAALVLAGCSDKSNASAPSSSAAGTSSAMKLSEKPAERAAVPISASDARGFVKVLAAVGGGGVDPVEKYRILLEGCSELKSCAGGCETVLRTSSGESIDDDQRTRLLSECFSDFKKAREKDPGLGGETWFMRYLADYAKRARSELSEAEQRSLESGVHSCGLDALH